MKITVILISILVISLAGGSNESLSMVNATEILNKFKNNENINYDSKLIEGDLFFNNSLNNKNEPIISNITIENSIIEGDVNISYMMFHKVSFFNSTFKGNFTALDSIFNDTNFSTCSFRGFVDFNRAKFFEEYHFEKTFVKEFAKFSFCKFYNLADFHEAVFNNSADLADIEFRNRSDFKRITFKRHAVFSNSVFYGICSFSGANFEWMADFANCDFKKTADFSASQFNFTSNFSGASFRDSAKFSGCRFNNGITMDRLNQMDRFNQMDRSNVTCGPININNAIFGGDATFVGARFANFTCWNCEFRKRCDFLKSDFRGDAVFKDSHFLGDSEFSEVKFGKNLDLSNCVFNNTLLLRRSNLNSSVNLMDSIFEKDIRADDAIFNGRLNMNRTQFGNMYVRWFNLRKRIQYNETAYHLLIKNFRNLGLFSDSNECYYAFMSDMRNQTAHQSFSGHSVLYSVLYSLSQFLYGFGTKPEYPLIWSGLFVLVFAFYWYINYRSITVGSIFDRYGMPKNNIGAQANGNMHSEFMRLFLLLNLA